MSDALSDAVPDAPVTVTAYPGGPLIVRGEFTVRDLDGPALDTGSVVALCRCGRSARKPLCDGSHRRSRSTGSARPTVD